MKLFIAVLSFFLLFSCMHEENESGTSNDFDQAAQLADCYTFASGNDTIILKPWLSGKNISGSLEYRYFEKDVNTGNIQGTFRGDLLVAEYTFLSEGRRSVRQVVFKRTPSGFVEGYGEITEKDGKSVFKSVHLLDYNHERVLRESACTD